MSRLRRSVRSLEAAAARLRSEVVPVATFDPKTGAGWSPSPPSRLRPYRERRVVARAETGEPVALVVPADVPSNERADELRRLYEQHVRHREGHWKGFAEAVVPKALAGDVAEAMNFMGSIVDGEEPEDGGNVRLWSRGYWAHGF